MPLKLTIAIDPPGTVATYDKVALRKVMRGALNEIAADARKRVRAAGAKGKRKPGQTLQSRTGRLRASIKPTLDRDGQGGVVSAIFYDRFSEIGAKGPGKRLERERPVLEAALEARGASIGDRVRQSITQDIAFRRMK